jgi:hypothetical protein
MPRPNFHDNLSLEGSRFPPVAGGPVDEAQQLNWVWAWIYQNGPNDAAAAARGGGGPFAQGEDWTVSLQSTPDSADFEAGRPAQATAIAMVVRGGQREAYWWSEAVLITD